MNKSYEDSYFDEARGLEKESSPFPAFRILAHQSVSYCHTSTRYKQPEADKSLVQVMPHIMLYSVHGMSATVDRGLHER